MKYDPSNDVLVHSDQDVAAYASSIAKGTKFTEVDPHQQAIIQTEEAQANDPYFMALNNDEFAKVHKDVLKNQQEKEAGQSQQDDDSELVQLLQAIQTHDNPWDTMIQMNHMTDSVEKKNEIKEVSKGPSAEELAKKKVDDQKEFEKNAIKEARNELLKPEPINHSALQTSNIKSQKTVDIESQKMNEIIDDNKEYATVQTDVSNGVENKKREKRSRASISSQLATQDDIDDMVNAPVVISKIDIDDMDNQKERNKKTMESLAGSDSFDSSAPATPQPVEKKEAEKKNITASPTLQKQSNNTSSVENLDQISSDDQQTKNETSLSDQKNETVKVESSSSNNSSAVVQQNITSQKAPVEQQEVLPKSLSQDTGSIIDEMQAQSDTFKTTQKNSTTSTTSKAVQAPSPPVQETVQAAAIDIPSAAPSSDPLPAAESMDQLDLQNMTPEQLADIAEHASPAQLQSLQALMGVPTEEAPAAVAVPDVVAPAPPVVPEPVMQVQAVAAAPVVAVLPTPPVVKALVQPIQQLPKIKIIKAPQPAAPVIAAVQPAQVAAVVATPPTPPAPIPTVQPPVAAPQIQAKPKFDMEKFKADVALKLQKIKNKKVAQAQNTTTASPPAPVVQIKKPVIAQVQVKPAPIKIAVKKPAAFAIIKKKPPPVAQFMKSIAVKKKPIIILSKKSANQTLIQKSPISPAPSTTPNVAPGAISSVGTATIGDVSVAEALVQSHVETAKKPEAKTAIQKAVEASMAAVKKQKDVQPIKIAIPSQKMVQKPVIPIIAPIDTTALAQKDKKK